MTAFGAIVRLAKHCMRHQSKGRSVMLASLLPGLRELRAPLAAGYVWLLGIWLSLRAMTVSADYPTGVYRYVLDLANWAGKPATFVASAFVAYLVGILSNAVTSVFNVALHAVTRGRLRELFIGSMNVYNTLGDAIINKLAQRFLDDASFQDQIMEQVAELHYQYVREELKRQRTAVWNRRTARERYAHRSTLFLISPPLLKNRAMKDLTIRLNILMVLVDVRQLVAMARKDLELMTPRLIGKDDAIHRVYDRLMSEGAFRVSMFLPMCYLFGILSLLVSPWWAIALVVPCALLYLGAQSRSLAREHLALAIAAERIESPELERLVRADIPFASYWDVILSGKRVDIPAF